MVPVGGVDGGAVAIGGEGVSVAVGSTWWRRQPHASAAYTTTYTTTFTFTFTITLGSSPEGTAGANVVLALGCFAHLPDLQDAFRGRGALLSA